MILKNTVKRTLFPDVQKMLLNINQIQGYILNSSGPSLNKAVYNHNYLRTAVTEKYLKLHLVQAYFSIIIVK